MAHAIHALPDAQARALARAYDSEVAARRRRLSLGGAVLLVLILMASRAGEVDPVKLVTHFGNFTDYLRRLCYLDSGELAPANPYEWFWGITQKNKWLPL